MPLALVKRAIHNHGNGATAQTGSNAGDAASAAALAQTVPLRPGVEKEHSQDQAANGGGAASTAVYSPPGKGRIPAALIAVIALLAGGAMILVMLVIMK
jgi:hypothetical protein